MHMDEDKNEIVFSGGKRLYANRGVIGLSVSCEISEGWDGGFDRGEMTKDEIVELATYMSEKWKFLADNPSFGGQVDASLEAHPTQR
jgi:hypothetical protein